jgi:hypothetical protein
MTDKLTYDIIEEARGRLMGMTPAKPIIRVFDFREQWRFPRSRKRRIQNKWSKKQNNWRPKLGQCYQINLPSITPTVVMGPDMKEKFDKMMATPHT